MSFKCQKCGTVPLPRTKLTRVVTKWRSIAPASEYSSARREIEKEENWCPSCVAQSSAAPETAMAVAMKAVVLEQ